MAPLLTDLSSDNFRLKMYTSSHIDTDTILGGYIILIKKYHLSLGINKLKVVPLSNCDST